MAAFLESNANHCDWINITSRQVLSGMSLCFSRFFFFSSSLGWISLVSYLPLFVALSVCVVHDDCRMSLCSTSQRRRRKRMMRNRRIISYLSFIVQMRFLFISLLFARCLFSLLGVRYMMPHFLIMTALWVVKTCQENKLRKQYV